MEEEEVVVERLREDMMVTERGRMARAICTEHTCWSIDIEVAIIVVSCRPPSLSPFELKAASLETSAFGYLKPHLTQKVDKSPDCNLLLRPSCFSEVIF